MNKRAQLVRLILLNILISAMTTLTVLFVWDRLNPKPEIVSFGCISETAPLSPLPTPIVNEEIVVEPTFVFPNEDIFVNIRAIVGAGDLAMEYVEVVNQGENPANLTGWQLINPSGNTFTFPTLILNSGGAIKVLSKTGTNSVIELFWQSDLPIWQHGDTARLLNADGEVVRTYSIP